MALRIVFIDRVWWNFINFHHDNRQMIVLHFFFLHWHPSLYCLFTTLPLMIHQKRQNHLLISLLSHLFFHFSSFYFYSQNGLLSFQICHFWFFWALWRRKERERVEKSEKECIEGSVNKCRNFWISTLLQESFWD